MTINSLFVLIILFSLGGIIFIIRRKIFFLAKIDLNQMPEEVAAKTKRDLLKKRTNRQISDFKNKIKLKINNLKFDFQKIFKIMKSKFQKGLDFLSKLAKLLRKYRPR